MDNLFYHRTLDYKTLNRGQLKNIVNADELNDRFWSKQEDATIYMHV